MQQDGVSATLHTLSLQRKADARCAINECTDNLTIATRGGQPACIGQSFDFHIITGRSLQHCIGLLEDAVAPLVDPQV